MPRGETHRELTGKRFGKLIAIEYIPGSKWKCKCDCGNETIVSTCKLTSGRTVSCGCHGQAQVLKGLRTSHGKRRTRLYGIWANMKTRCFNPNDPHFERWGGRGITVCDEWKNDFQSFYEYVSKLEYFGEPGRTLDRINNDGNYEPGNVRWATVVEQNQNKRNVRKKVIK